MNPGVGEGIQEYFMEMSFWKRSMSNDLSYIFTKGRLTNRNGISKRNYGVNAYNTSENCNS